MKAGPIQPKQLSEYSTKALISELQRRENVGGRRSSVSLCDECSWFKIAPENAPDDYNPCSLGHELLFRSPRTPNPDEEVWGFYRPKCRDRKLTP